MSVFAKMIIPEIPKKKRVSKERFLLDFEFLAKPRLNKKVDQYYKVKNPALLRYVDNENKVKVYLGLIKKAVKADKQVLIVVPQLNDIKKIYQYLLEYKNQITSHIYLF